MSTLFFKRFLVRPMQVASIVPSSRVLVKRVSSKFDFGEPRTIVEFGPGEGCHTREIVRRMHPESRLLLFELDPELAAHLDDCFRDDPRVEVLNADAQDLLDELARRGIRHCDYVVSGIPFSILETGKKQRLLQKIHQALAPAPHAAFIIYQVTAELRAHATSFPRLESEYCLQNLPPMFVIKFYKQALNGNGNGNGKHHAVNGHGKR
jgi:phosphatidylethanolamine/phosphatidyl-N-methylethanolamine N-methyltransferase